MFAIIYGIVVTIVAYIVVRLIKWFVKTNLFLTCVLLLLFYGSLWFLITHYRWFLF